VQGVLDWLAALPTVWLYVAMGVAAALENIFPPLPADTVVAFGSFLAARGEGTIIGSFLSTLIGNLAGASVMYGAGRRFGAERIERHLLRTKGESAETRLRSLYERYGLGALFLSRFVPGVRAVVPPFAGAIRLPFLPALLVMGVASGIWYGLISFLAFRIGADWNALQGAIGRFGKISAAIALAVVALVAIIWFFRKQRHHKRREGSASRK
jgi:membrane protein DedA with SNARE-associated domain